jgi:hypothetical protein
VNRSSGQGLVATFLVERYWPGIDAASLPAVLQRLDAAAQAMTAEGTPVRHLGSILMPVDEVVFSLITAGDESLVREVNARAELPVDRVSTAITLAAVPVPGPTGGLTT